MKIFKHIIACAFPIIALLGCSASKSNSSSSSESSEETEQQNVVEFNQDSALAFVKAQCDFGPRVPNTEAHRKCGSYLVAKLKATGANVIEQDMKLKAFDGTTLNAKNIIAEINPDSTENRILLLAHWDCRPWADNDPDPAKRKMPVMGANDGASGVGVLLEIARLCSVSNPGIGIDILLVDAEDWGNSDGDDEGSWALGTQYWVAHRHRPNYQPAFGILLDMVGASGANFAKEYFSMSYARGIVETVWNVAQQAGYASFFTQQNGGGITDDHVFINRGGIPCIDIIHYDAGSGTGFYPGWHTTHDTFDVIDPASLKAVGQTLTNLIYHK